MSALFIKANEYLEGVETEGLNTALVPFVDALEMSQDVRAYLVTCLANDERAFRRLATREAEQNAQRPTDDVVEEPVVEEESVADEVDPIEEAKRHAEAERKQREWQDNRESNRDKIAGHVSSFLDSVAANLKMEWTAELLNAEFSPNHSGGRTTWGEASREQHERRIELLTANVHNNAELIARHRCAIDTIDQTGAENLNDAMVLT